ncbi:MAG: hypothetical protein DRP65_00050 [Planctomycetota bacterium]|nr:MAG: hypothetical protein DRP65_00050 [Planctomycetota bacterium]
MNGDYERVDWEDAVSTGRGPERNTDIYDGQVEWDSTVKEVRGVRHASKEIKRAVFGDSAGTVRDTRARGTSGRQESRTKCTEFVIEVWLIFLGVLALLGVFALFGVWLAGLGLVMAVKVSIPIRILLVVVVLPLYPLALAPLFWVQSYSERLSG